MVKKKRYAKTNPAERHGCGWFEAPAACNWPRNDAEHPQTTWYAPHYDCATCPATVANRQKYKEREREAMRGYA